MARGELPKIGDESGKLTVSEVFKAVRGSRMRSAVICDCRCGKTGVRVPVKDFKRGNTKSCGCNNHRQGDKSRTPEYYIWTTMIRRCTDQQCLSWKDYGGRGVTVCQRWRESFIAFLEDMGPRPTPAHTIGRIRNEEGYGPDNCQWETRIEQGNNKRNNRFLTHNGETLTVAQWSRKTGLPRCRIEMRLKSGWTVERTLSTIGDARR